MLVLSQQNSAAMVVMNLSAEASTSVFHYVEEDGNEVVATILSKKNSRSPVWHLFKPTEQRSSKGILLAKCTHFLCIPPKHVALIGVNNTTNMIQHLLRKHTQEYIVDIRVGQKVIIAMLYFN